jgi:hypothetical protein
LDLVSFREGVFDIELRERASLHCTFCFSLFPVSASLAVCNDPALSAVAADRRPGHLLIALAQRYFPNSALLSRT